MDKRKPRSVHVSSFAAHIGRDCRVLVLGSMPGERSLSEQQYYAHPHNLFWPFMGELCAAGPELAYADRLKRLQAAGIGVWDVLQHCERIGSLDSAIVAASEHPNDIAGLLLAHPSIRAIAFNGAKARQAFDRHLRSSWPASLASRVESLGLPSTSPANASIGRAAKLAAWLKLRDYLRTGTNPPGGR